MPDKEVLERAKRDLAQGKTATTAAGEFVHEEIEHVREGKHGARSTKQAIAIGLSEARRAGIPLPPPRSGRVPEKTRQSAKLDSETGQRRRTPRAPSPRRKRATLKALQREGHDAASPAALSRQAKTAAARRSPAQRSRAAKTGAASKSPAQRSRAARKGAATRRRSRE